jgi:uncharacterized protein (TIGR02996 family)
MTSLDEALSLFAQTRSALLSHAIESLGREALEGFVAPTPKKNLEFHRAWQELCLEPTKLSWCLHALIEKLPKLLDGKEHSSGDKCDALVERLDVLTKLKPDPRIAQAVLALNELRAPVCNFSIVIESMAHALVRHADDETVSSPLLKEFLSNDEAAEIVDNKLPKPSPLNAEQTARWTKRKVAKRDLTALFEMVYAAPHADEPREVLADALQEVGDVRGEFIALQLREHRGDTSVEVHQRAQQLLAKNANAWLGPLRPIVYRAEMRRGFLSRIELAGSWASDKWKTIAQERMLATIENIEMGQATGKIYGPFLTGTLAQTVESIEVSDDEALKSLENVAFPNLKELISLRWTRHSHEERFLSRIVPWIEQHEKVVRLGCELDQLPHLSKTKLASLTDVTSTAELKEALKWWRKLPNLKSLTCGWGDRIVLVRSGKQDHARIFAARFGGQGPEIASLPKSIRRVEVIGNVTLAKHLQTEHLKRFEIVALKSPSGLITATK